MIQMHYNYGHAPFNYLKTMSANFVLPKRLAGFTFPVCATFIYGKAIKIPHKTKTSRSINEYKPVAYVGDFVSLDVLVSRTPGLVAQMSVYDDSTWNGDVDTSAMELYMERQSKSPIRPKQQDP